MTKRRRGARSAGARPRPSRHRPFESLVELALASIPEPFVRALDEVAIVIADEPTAEQRRENEIDDDDTVYGLYEGVPRPRSSPSASSTTTRWARSRPSSRHTSTGSPVR